MNGLLVAPGFGERGIEGKIQSIRFARENNLPFLGICLGMQMAVIEFARNVVNLQNANSTEMDISTKHPVITLMENQIDVDQKGGTMRLGSWKCKIEKNTLAKKIYKKEVIAERHRHRYELNFEYMDKLKKAGMVFSNLYGVQFHPEYQSTVKNPHPLFVSFVEACKKTI